MSLIMPKIKLKNSTFCSIFKAFKRFLSNHFSFVFFIFGYPLATHKIKKSCKPMIYKTFSVPRLGIEPKSQV